MTEVFTASSSATETSEDPGQAKLRELLVHFQRSLGTVQWLAAALLDISQPGADPLTPEQARANRHAIGEAFASVERGEALAKELWAAFGVERRMVKAPAPLPRGLKQDRRRKPRKGAAA